jgi:F0F1-type ATP synthase assembly protein I
MPDDPNPAAQLRYAAVVFQVVTEMVAPVVLGLLIDWAAGTMPWLTIGGVLAGFWLGVRSILRITAPKGNPGDGPTTPGQDGP